MNWIEVGKRLRALRLEYGYSQMYVAKRVGVAQSNVCNWEYGRYGITVEHLISLAKLYETDVNYILTGKKSGRPKRVKTGKLIDGDELLRISYGPGEDVTYEHVTAKS
jgi:transcriptional regulator with XRE-family HTH domain